MKIFSAVATLFLISHSYCSEKYNYEDKGPDAWPFLVDGKCAGEKQSPIDIFKCDTIYNPVFKDYTFENYAKSVNWNVSNNGHTIVFTPIEETLLMTGSDLYQNYKLLQFHFHWGENNYQGSEHYIDEYKYPLEVHFVHQAANGEYAVLGFFFKLGNGTNPFLDSIIDAVSKTINSSISTQVVADLSKVLPINQKLTYFRYEGSLTTPPCTEGIRWTVFEKTIPISQTQLDAFHKNVIAKNFRSLQKLRKRNVYSNTKYYYNSDSQICSGGSALEKIHGLGLFLLILLKFLV